MLRPRRELTGACVPTSTPASAASATASVRVTSPPTSSGRHPHRLPACGSLRLQPIPTHAHVNHERRGVLPPTDHLLLDQHTCHINLGGGPFEKQLVVDREDLLGGEAGLVQSAMAAHHRELDDVGGGALNDRIDSQALAERSHPVVAGAQLGNLAAPTP